MKKRTSLVFLLSIPSCFCLSGCGEIDANSPYKGETGVSLTYEQLEQEYDNREEAAYNFATIVGTYKDSSRDEKVNLRYKRQPDPLSDFWESVDEDTPTYGIVFNADSDLSANQYIYEIFDKKDFDIFADYEANPNLYLIEPIKYSYSYSIKKFSTGYELTMQKRLKAKDKLSPSSSISNYDRVVCFNNNFELTYLYYKSVEGGNLYRIIPLRSTTTIEISVEYSTVVDFVE